jgi:PAS domain S-box-containing protein
MSLNSSPPDHKPASRWERECRGEPACVPELRNGVSEFARSTGAGDSVVTDVALAVSEAVTNAVMHAFIDSAPGRVRVISEPGDGCLIVRVLDDGRGMMPRSDSPGLGLGLPMIGQFTSSVDIRPGLEGRGTEVRMVFEAPGLTGPPLRAEGWRFELLAEVGALAEASGWPGHGLHRLVDLLVPDVADACAIDLAGEDREPRRVAARVHGERGAELSAWLAARRPPPEAVQHTIAALEAGQSPVTRVDEETLQLLARDEREAELMAGLDIAYWVNLPLRAGDQLLGSLGLGLAGSRDPIEDQLGFYEALAERAAKGLANTQLIGELRRTHRRLERILGSLAEAITVHDEQGRTVYANDAAARLLGAASVDEVLAAQPGELAARFVVTREDGSPVATEDLPGRRLLAGEAAPALLTRSVERASGREYWLLTKATLLDDEGLLAVNIIEDVTEAKTAELRQRFLAEASQLLVSDLSHQQALERVAGLTVPALADWCAVDLLDEHGRLERVALKHADPEKEALGRGLQRDYPPDLEAAGGLGGVLRGGPSELYTHISDEMLAAGAVDDRHLALLRAVGMRSAMVVPMRVGERTIGALSFVNAESRRAFEDDDVAFAEDVAHRVALLLDRHTQ